MPRRRVYRASMTCNEIPWSICNFFLRLHRNRKQNVKLRTRQRQKEDGNMGQLEDRPQHEINYNKQGTTHYNHNPCLIPLQLHPERDGSLRSRDGWRSGDGRGGRGGRRRTCPADAGRAALP